MRRGFKYTYMTTRIQPKCYSVARNPPDVTPANLLTRQCPVFAEGHEPVVHGTTFKRKLVGYLVGRKYRVIGISEYL